MKLTMFDVRLCGTVEGMSHGVQTGHSIHSGLDGQQIGGLYADQFRRHVYAVPLSKI